MADIYEPIFAPAIEMETGAQKNPNISGIQVDSIHQKQSARRPLYRYVKHQYQNSEAMNSFMINRSIGMNTFVLSTGIEKYQKTNPMNGFMIYKNISFNISIPQVTKDIFQTSVGYKLSKIAGVFTTINFIKMEGIIPLCYRQMTTNVQQTDPSSTKKSKYFQA